MDHGETPLEWDKYHYHKPLNMLQWGYTMSKRWHLTSFTTHSIVSSTNTSFGILSAVMMDNAAEAASNAGITRSSINVRNCCISSSDSSQSLQQHANNLFFVVVITVIKTKLIRTEWSNKSKMLPQHTCFLADSLNQYPFRLMPW